MDLLKLELERKRRLLHADFGGRKLIKRSEIEHKELQRLRDQERRLLHSKLLRRSSHHPNHSDPNPSPAPANDQDDDSKNSLPRDEVVRRLRLLKQPATLFGEDDAARLSRLDAVIESGPIEVEADLMADGQTNDFLRDILVLRRRQKEGAGENGTASGDRDGSVEVSGAGSKETEADEESKLMKADFKELRDEDKILVFFKRLLNEWNQELGQMTQDEKRTAKGKFMLATFNHCARYLNPLFNMCRKKDEDIYCMFKNQLAEEDRQPLTILIELSEIADEICKALVIVVECCTRRDYLSAMDQYIKLAIGNAPWPIGVTMVGIHERSAREKIYTNSVAHIMNDETTRKYLQSVKRLMTFCQRRYPTDLSRSVEFNSLAYGSDLQSLLAEQRTSAVKEEQEGMPSQKKLQAEQRTSAAKEQEGMPSQEKLQLISAN